MEAICCWFIRISCFEPLACVKETRERVHFRLNLSYCRGCKDVCVPAFQNLSAERNHFSFTRHHLKYSAMEAVLRVKKSLKKPIRKLTSCVLVEKKRLCDKRRPTRGRGGSNKSRKNNPTIQSAHPRNSAMIRSYQTDLEKERKLREAMNTQKNAERAAMRAHFRRKYQLSEDPKDSHHLHSVGGRVSLPCELSKIIYPESKTKDEGFNLLSALQGLSFGSDVFTGKKPSWTSTPSTSGVDACTVM